MKYLIGGVIIGFIALVFFSFGYASNDPSLENDLLNKVVDIENKAEASALERQVGRQHYDKAGIAYEISDYLEVEIECKIARDHYLISSQGFKNVRAELNAAQLEDPIANDLLGMFNTSIRMANNLFEACEHFESASRYYEFYYQESTPSDDMSHEMGTGEIDMMNEKIKAHDIAVEEYNTYLARFTYKLENNQ